MNFTNIIGYTSNLLPQAISSNSSTNATIPADDRSNNEMKNITTPIVATLPLLFIVAAGIGYYISLRRKKAALTISNRDGVDNPACKQQLSSNNKEPATLLNAAALDSNNQQQNSQKMTTY